VQNRSTGLRIDTVDTEFHWLFFILLIGVGFDVLIQIRCTNSQIHDGMCVNVVDKKSQWLSLSSTARVCMSLLYPACLYRKSWTYSSAVCMGDYYYFYIPKSTCTALRSLFLASCLTSATLFVCLFVSPVKKKVIFARGTLGSYCSCSAG
jgi:hypothetical protein